VMVTADQILAEAHPKLLTIIKHHMAAGHDKMSAYDRAASEVGRSRAWIQRVIGRRPQATVAAHDWLNITALCARIEASTARKDAHAAAIHAEIAADRTPADRRPAERSGNRGARMGSVPPVDAKGSR
jgi:hypothetical protein